MKKAFVYMLVGVLLAPVVLKLGVYADFKQHQDYIARALCINKDKPRLACNGYCQLQSRLQSIDGQKQDAPAQETKAETSQEWILFFVPALALRTPPAFREASPRQGIYYPLFSTSYLLSVFHPPPLNATRRA